MQKLEYRTGLLALSLVAGISSAACDDSDDLGAGCAEGVPTALEVATRRAEAVVEQFGKDGAETISRAEWLEGAASDYASLDALEEGDGLSVDAEGTFSLYLDADADSDGTVDQDEFLAGAGMFFDDLDVDGDGGINVDELASYFLSTDASDASDAG